MFLGHHPYRKIVVRYGRTGPNSDLLLMPNVFKAKMELKQVVWLLEFSVDPEKDQSFFEARIFST